MDADGYIKITGRIKDLIIRGGENIHPLEIENCLLACPSIADVSVVGIPDPRYGEVVAAFVIPIGGKEVIAEEIRDWVRTRLSHHLGVYFSVEKNPNKIIFSEFFFFSSYPQE